MTRGLINSSPGEAADNSVSFTFTTVAYNASWQPPVVTGASLANGDVVWTKPDASTFTGKAPAITNFSQVGTYTCEISDKTKITGFSFAQSATRNFVSDTNFGAVVGDMSSLTTLSWRRQAALAITVEEWVLPVSITTLSNSFGNCSSITGNIPDFSMLTNLESLSGTFSSCSSMSGAVAANMGVHEDVLALIGLGNCITGSGLTADLSTWDLATFTSLTLESVNLSYGTGGALVSLAAEGSYFYLVSCQLTQADIDRILSDCVDSNDTWGELYLTGNTAPSAAGLADKATLEGRDWYIEVD